MYRFLQSTDEYDILRIARLNKHETSRYRDMHTIQLKEYIS